jgi:hypothetical protein
MTFLRFILFPLVPIYKLIVAIRNFLFDKSIFRTHKINAKIISIGNIVQKPRGALLALAPFYEGKISEELEIPVGTWSTQTRADLFKPLPNSGAEAQSIAQLTHGEVLLGAKASKSKFIEKCRD